MSHSTIQHVKQPAKVGTPGSAGAVATTTPSTAGKPVRAETPATTCSKGRAVTPTTPLVKQGTSAIAETSNRKPSGA
jgi:hypothetical protein